MLMIDKLAILADAAKYDASCASSAAPRRDSRGGRGVGSTGGTGICHSYTPDGRCISLLKILLTNYCMFNCAYCVNRISSNVPRARFTVEEVVQLTLDFYKRNYIEGLFLSSGIIRSPDATMAELVRVAQLLRETHDFRGYIHLKTIPDADPELLRMAGIYADRLSINIELSNADSLNALAPEKSALGIRQSMARLKNHIVESRGNGKSRTKAPRFSPAGQSTQMIVGADHSSDVDILSSSVGLYASYDLKRVYYSAFSPIPDASSSLPLVAPPLVREHRLYQADWMFRFYGFSLDEIASAATNGMFDMSIDPKLAWALNNRAHFPVDINSASKEMLLRVPGIGPRGVRKILAARRFQRLSLDDVKRLAGAARRTLPFITASAWTPKGMLDSQMLREQLIHKPRQLDLFSA